MEKTAADDRLLVRDCQQFKWHGGHVDTVPGHPHRRRHLELMLEFTLPSDVIWQTAVGGDGYFLAAGINARDLLLVRGTWGGKLQERHVKLEQRRFDNIPLIVQSCSKRGQDIVWWISAYGCAPIKPVVFESTDWFPTMTAMTPSWLPPSAIGLAAAVTGITWGIHVEDQHLVASAYRGHEIAWTALLPDMDTTLPFVSVPMLAAGSELVVGVGSRVLIRNPDKPGGFHVQTEVGDRIVALKGNERRLTGPVVVATEGQGRVLWPTHGKTDSHWEASPILGQAFGFTRSHALVAAADRELQYYQVHGPNRQVRLQWTVQTSFSDPVAVLPTDSAQSIGIVSSNGEVHVYQPS